MLRAMSLTTGFARLVVLAGHGANVVNNPHASGLHCGACGGYSGEVNARLLAGILNDAYVRRGLVSQGIEIPADTLFVPALHDTTTDAVTLYTKDCISAAHVADLNDAGNSAFDGDANEAGKFNKDIIVRARKEREKKAVVP